MAVGLVAKRNWLKASKPRVAIGVRDGKLATGATVSIREVWKWGWSNGKERRKRKVRRKERERRRGKRHRWRKERGKNKI